MKRFTTALTVALMLLSTLTACSGGSGGPAETTAAPSGETVSSETTAAELKPDLPATDLKGADFHYLTKMEGSETGRWTAHDIFVEEQNGDIVNDAVWERNSIVEEKYNMKVKQTRMNMGGQYSYTMYNEISKLILAGDSVYDVVMPTIQDAALLARDAMLFDLNTLGYVDLEMPWWNQQFNSDTGIGGRSYYANGDISMTFMRAVYTILFNKQLIADYKLEDPYKLVGDRKWTIDKVLEMSAKFASDVNGDGKLDDSDNTGLIVLNNQVEALYTASGEKFVTVDKAGTFSFTGGGARSISILEKIYKLYESKNSVLCATDGSRRSSATASLGHVEAAAAAFAANRNLFLLGTMNNVPSMRDMSTDFGILPLPMGDEAQDSYYSYVQTWASGCAAITIVAKDSEKSAIVLEDMAYYAREITTPAYYDVSLKTKFTRDEESQEMLDIIYECRTCDLGNLYNIGELVSGVTQMIYPNAQNTFASFIASKEESVKTTLAELTKLYKE